VTCFALSTACGRIGYDPAAELPDIDAAPFADASSAWWDDAWLGRSRLRLDNRGVNEELLSFPLLVPLRPANFDYSQALADGSDLRFVAGDGITELAHEVERFVPGGDSAIWVSVPRVLADSDQTTVWMYFGNATPGVPRASTEVWKDFHVVYHMSDATTDSTGKYPGVPGDGVAMQVPGTGSGQMGGAQDFDGVDDIITVAGDSFNFTQPGLTMGAWVHLDNLRPDWNNFLGISGFNTGYRMGIHGVNGQSGFQCPGLTHTMNSANLVLPTGWHYIVATWDGEFMRHYFDGVLDVVPLAKTDGIVPSTSDFHIGLAQFPFRGLIDEVRVANIGRSADWIAASFRSMNGTMVIFE
jgi:biopolymer transport protein ExbB